MADRQLGDGRTLPPTSLLDSRGNTRGVAPRTLHSVRRLRKSGKDTDRPTGNMMWAEHVHRTTKPVGGLPDPQLHIHATAINATFDSVAEMEGHSARRHRPRQSLLPGCVPCAAGVETERSRLRLGRRTRESNGRDGIAMPELRAEWNSRLTAQERLVLQTAGSGWQKGDDTITPHQAKDYALQHSSQNASAVSDKRLQSGSANLRRRIDQARRCCRFGAARGSDRPAAWRA
jgi:TrwC relaxase